MNIDYELYSNNRFYRRLVDRAIEDEQIRQKQQALLIGYANQIPFHTMRQTTPYTLQAQYATIENNYVDYWGKAYQVEQQEQQYRQNFKNAIDAASHVTEETNPVASIVFDGIGLLNADNLYEALNKMHSIITKAQKL